MGAAHNGDAELTRLLLARNADVNAVSPDNDGTVKNGPVVFGTLTALHLAVADASPVGCEAAAGRGASVNRRDARGMTPLMWASRQRSTGAADRPDAPRSRCRCVDRLERRRDGRALGAEI
jgi:ankyrin repeat protein